jgi:hypothetical protein
VSHGTMPLSRLVLHNKKKSRALGGMTVSVVE